MSLGKKIKELRRKSGLSQKDLADYVGVSQAYISKIEEEKRQPTFRIVVLIANALNITMDELL